MERKQLIELAKVVAKADSSSKTAYSYGDEKFSYAELNETLRKELNEIAGTYQLYRENQNLVFALIGEIIDNV